LESKQLFTLIMSTGWMTQVAPMPDNPPFINGLTALHTDTGTFVSSDRDAILAWAMFSSLSLFSSTHCYLSVCLSVCLSGSFAASFVRYRSSFGTIQKRENNFRSSLEERTFYYTAGQRQDRSKSLEDWRWGKEEKNGGANEGRKAHHNHESSPAARRKKHTHTRTHAPCVDRRRKTYGTVDVGDGHKPFLSFFLSCVLPSSPNPLSSGRGHVRPCVRPSVGWRRR
jgi:hypothetical protein